MTYKVPYNPNQFYDSVNQYLRLLNNINITLTFQSKASIKIAQNKSFFH